MKSIIFCSFSFFFLFLPCVPAAENLSEDEKWEKLAPGFRDYKCSSLLVDLIVDRKKVGQNVVASAFYLWKHDQENRELPTKKKVRELGKVAGELCTYPQNHKKKVITIIDQNY